MNDHSEPRDEDVSREELLARIARLRREALHDPLTGVANRALFMDRLERTRAYARRTRNKFAVLLLDLDGFKSVNDRFGHDAGDRLLRAVAGRIGTGMRESDTVARLGGDEFGVVLFGTDRDGAEQVSSRLRVALGRAIKVGNDEVATGVSIGFSVFPDDSTEPLDLLRVADAAMYDDKSKRYGEQTGPVGSVFRKLSPRRRRV